MFGTVAVLFWWLLFAGTHLGLSTTSGRRALVDRTGERGFLALYSIVSFATFVPLAWTYAHHRHVGPLLWTAPLGSAPHLLGWIASALGWMLVVLALVQPSPVGLAPGAAAQPRGIVRITRHPLFTGLGLWGIGHALLNGFLSDVAFFAGFALFGWAGAAHQDARKRRAPGDPLGAFYAQTSAVPFAAIVAGRTRFVASEISPVGLGAGALVALGLYLAHGWMFGR